MSVRALWVEEEPESLVYERKLAEENGWQITSVATVREALDLVAHRPFDVLLVDLILPLSEYELRRGHVSVDAGLALIRSIRDPLRCGATGHDVPLLVISAVVTPDRKAVVLDSLASPTHYLDKPVDEVKYRQMISEFSAIVGSAK
jgi:CheY-like chemotaxis protein